MKVTKYPQSCLLLEKLSGRILIDPGSFAMAEFKWADFGKVDAVIYTHRHRDHLEPELLDQIKTAGIPIYANVDAAEVVGGEVNVVTDGQEFEVAGYQIKVHDLPHCRMSDGSEGPPNTGYLIDGSFFHPGDGIETSNVAVRDLAAPIEGPTIDPAKAVEFAKSVGAKRAIPIHYSNPDYPAEPNEFAKLAGSDFQVILLGDGESTEL